MGQIPLTEMFAEVKGLNCNLWRDKCINVTFVHKVGKAWRSVEQSQQSIPGKSGYSEDP